MSAIQSECLKALKKPGGFGVNLYLFMRSDVAFFASWAVTATSTQAAGPQRLHHSN